MKAAGRPRVLIVGGGPAGLSLASLVGKAGRASSVTVLERACASDSPGWGITLRSNALSFLGLGESLAMDRLEGRSLWHGAKPVIDLPYPPTVQLVSVSRTKLLGALRERALDAGAQLIFDRDSATLTDSELELYDLVVAADGASSAVRKRYAQSFGATAAVGRNWYAWLATPRVFPKLTILVGGERIPLLAWAYRYAADRSTLIVECSDAAFRRLRFAELPPEMCGSRIAKAFESELGGKPVLSGSAPRWQRFQTVSCRRLVHGNVVLLGDAAHTTHYSQGFGTMFAFDDALALHSALCGNADVASALAAYEASQRPKIAALQATATTSMRWAEAMLDAVEQGGEGQLRNLIAARWPDNAITAGPLDALATSTRTG